MCKMYILVVPGTDSVSGCKYNDFMIMATVSSVLLQL